MPIEAAPIVVEPSGNFLGDDGAWSTFVVSAGSPPQSLQVLASTEVASTWVVLPDGCGTNDAPNCTTSRGGAYDVTKSSTWNSKGIFLLGAESTLGYAGPGNDVNGTYGYDTLALAGSSGAANISVDHQVIAAIITDDFFVGNLGLSNQAINMTSSADSSPSFLTSLKNQNLIPTLSYGYTAGASYQQKNGVNGSLTLGGYDASRFTHNDISFTFAPLGTRQLVVAIPSITFSNSKTQTSLLSQPIMALVDSTVPHMWLPQDACKAFEQAFGLIWDPVHSLYTVNDTAHKTLLQENPSVIFELSNSNSGPSVNITLPYASFDLTANYPLVKSQTRFFPLQRGSDNSKYTLGRTFLQESFLIVNYEHSNFSISQAVYDPSTPSHIVAIPSTSTTGTASANPTSSGSPILKTTGSGPHGSGSHSIGTGAIAGIAIAIVLIASLIGAFFITKRIRKQRSLRTELEGDEPKDTQEMSIEYALKQDISKDSNGLEAKNRNTTIEVKEVPLTPPLSEMGAEIHGFFGADCGKQPLGPLHHEMPGSPVNRSELSSPEPWSRIELPSPDPEALRSELSTPEPMYINSELPTPDPSHELPSPGMSEAFGPVSPRTDNRRSALNSPMPRLPLQRPMSERLGSSESEAGLTFDGVPRPGFHRRYHSDDSDGHSLQSMARPILRHMDSEDSESDFIHSNHRGVETLDSDIISPVAPNSRPGLTRMDSSASESEGISSLPSISSRPRILQTHLDSSSGEESPISQPRQAFRHVVGLSSNFYSSSVSRPAMRRSVGATPQRPASNRFDESDSDAWQTRLDSPSTEAPSDVSRFNFVNHGER